MKMHSLSLLCLILCIQAVAFVACRSTQTDMGLIPSGRHIQQQTNTRVTEAVVHHGKGSNGASDLLRKPSKNNGVVDLPGDTLGGITFWVSMVANCFFLLI